MFGERKFKLNRMLVWDKAPSKLIGGGLVVVAGFIIGVLFTPYVVSFIWDEWTAKSIVRAIEKGDTTTSIVFSDEQLAEAVNSANSVFQSSENNLTVADTINNIQVSVDISNNKNEISAQNSFVRRLYIPIANVDMPIVEGSNEKVLFKGSWRSPYSSTPEHGGNTVLFGHRYLHLPPRKDTLFSLDKVKVGDAFDISWDGKSYKYKVAEVKIVNPDDISVLGPTVKSSVTIITCTPVFTTKFRLVVRGELIME